MVTLFHLSSRLVSPSSASLKLPPKKTLITGEMSSLPSSPDVNRSVDFLKIHRNEIPSKTIPECERRFSCTTRYTKSHATMTWEIRDVIARDTHGERLRSAEFVVGADGANQTSWVILCNFGTQNYEDYVSAHVKLISKGHQVCADVELFIIGAYGNKVNTETKVARLFSNDDSTNDASANNESTWGYFSFAKRADLRFNPDLVPNDTLTLATRVSVYGRDETTSSLDAAFGVGEGDVHVDSLTSDLTALFVDAQDDHDSGVAQEESRSSSSSDDMIVIQTPNKQFVVHRNILSARSLVFRRMLQQTIPDAAAPALCNVAANAAAATWSETGSRRVSIPDVDDDVMRHFLLYVYGACVPTEMDEQLAEELLILADKYDVERLKTACEYALAGCISEVSVPRLLVIADRHRCSQLKAAALNFLTRHPTQILQSAEWKMIEKNHPSLVGDALRTLALGS